MALAALSLTGRALAQSPDGPLDTPEAIIAADERAMAAPGWRAYTIRVIPKPEDTVKQLMESYRAGDMTATRTKYTTAVGRRVLDWLIAQPWFDEKSSPIVIERKQEGDRFEIVCLFKGKDGAEKVAAVFFLQDGVMKFHDLFLFEMKGDRFDMSLSYVLGSPWLANAEFAWKNPGKVLGPSLEFLIGVGMKAALSR
jgi:hypothetical protein